MAPQIGGPAGPCQQSASRVAGWRKYRSNYLGAERARRERAGEVDRIASVAWLLRSEGQPDLANNLHPELQGGASTAPITLGQSGPDVRGPGKWIGLRRWHGSSDRRASRTLPTICIQSCRVAQVPLQLPWGRAGQT